jgi:hypothetical protein
MIGDLWNPEKAPPLQKEELLNVEGYGTPPENSTDPPHEFQRKTLFPQGRQRALLFSPLERHSFQGNESLTLLKVRLLNC